MPILTPYLNSRKARQQQAREQQRENYFSHKHEPLMVLAILLKGSEVNNWVESKTKY
jgi:hypothetical protein